MSDCLTMNRLLSFEYNFGNLGSFFSKDTDYSISDAVDAETIKETVSFLQLDKVGDIDLSEELTIQTVISNKGFTIFKCDLLHIYEDGQDYDEAYNNFCEFFESDSDFYMNMNDDNLDENAIKLKNKYKNLIMV